MFNRDFWSEIFMALRRNKLRTILTGFAISWGIFMLIILLSAGNGLKNGVTSNFADRIKNTYTIWSSSTELPYKGHKAGRFIMLSNKDIQLLESLYQVDEVSPVVSKGGTLIFSEKSRSIYIEGVKPIYKNIEGIKILEGRFINERDMKTKSKVVIIDENTNKEFLRTTGETSMIGKTVYINGLSFTVVGVCKANAWGERGMGYAPYSTLQAIYNVNEYYQLIFTTKGLDTKEENEAFAKEVRKKLAALHEFSPDEQRGVWIESQMVNSLETMRIFNTISIFIWVIGIAMLISGVVGVSNIMRITVKERTNEIGIRKALGAKPRSILLSIVMESLVITTIFGYIGMICGVGVMEIVNMVMEASGAGTNSEMGMSVFVNPTVDIQIVVMATVVLIVSGVAAGFAPAWKSVKVKPIEAMNYR
ncbi:MAG: ABC transporter permease [Bacteroidales bacterium]|nr:ABC transporter permease [Bacteroidales bacterium]